MSILLAPGVAIEESEIAFRASRAGGPGGQHVNRTSTRVQLSWNIAESPGLSPAVRERLLLKLRSRLSADSVLTVTVQTERSQHRNREEALKRLSELVRRALAPERKRRATRPTRASVQRRLDTKQKRAELKRERSKRPPARDG